MSDSAHPPVMAPPRSRPLSPYVAWGLVCASGGIWGLTFSLAKIVTDEGAPPLGVAYWQAIIGALVLVAVLLLRRQHLPIDAGHLRFYAICGFIGTALPSSLFLYAALHLQAGVMSITISSVPILTFVGALMLRLDIWGWGRGVGIALGMIAVLLIAVPETSLPDPEAAPWVLVALVVSLSYATENLYIAKSQPPGTGAFTVLAGMQLMAFIMLAPVVLATDTFLPFSWPWGVVEYCVIGMSLINILCYGTFIYLVSATGPVFAAQMGYVITLAGIAWGIVLLGEVHSNWVWAALACMLVGLTLVQPSKVRRRTDS